MGIRDADALSGHGRARWGHAAAAGPGDRRLEAGSYSRAPRWRRHFSRGEAGMRLVKKIALQTEPV